MEIKSVRDAETVENVDQRVRTASNVNITVRVVSVTIKNEAIRIIRRNIRRTDQDLVRETSARCIEQIKILKNPFKSMHNELNGQDA